MRSFYSLISPSISYRHPLVCRLRSLRHSHSSSLQIQESTVTHTITQMDATVESLRRALAEKQSRIEAQGNIVRELKASGAAKPEISAVVEALNAMKLEKASIESQLQAAVSGTGGSSSVNRDAFRQAVVNTLERRLFYIPSFKIYRGVAGLYDYGPPGCAVKSNVLAFWRQHFVLEENMLEVDCPCVTPEVVLKASGHVDKFTDLMVKDEKTGTCYRADHLLKDFCKERLEKDLSMPAERAAELKHVLAVLDDLSAEELGGKIKEYGIMAPDTENPLSDPYPFNLMFQTSIGPSGLSPGYMRPETAQGIFVNFKDLYYYNGNKLPFAAAQIGQAFRNEISPRQGLLRVREFTLAEIEHFVDPEDKSHPKYSEVSNLEFLMFPREEQMSGQSAKRFPLGEAVSRGIVNNETLAYFIGRVYLFLTRLGVDKERLRFRQHLANEMAHYAADCWDAEIECSYGWIECVGIADRSAYDLRAHTEKSGTPLVAHEKFSEPREVEKLVIAPVKKELGLAFKGNQKMVVEALEAMDEKEAMDLKATLEAEGEAEFHVCTLGKVVTIKKNMVTISKENKKEHQRVCRRVYDIESKCLWWLTDQDYINSCFWTQERQEEVDQLLDKTIIEMYGAVQSGGRSPKPLNGPTGTPQLKPGSDSVQNNTSSVASQVKGKKRDRSEQGSDPIKRERLSKIDDADSGQSRPEHMMKSEIAKITDKGGLVDFEGVEKLVQLMQPNNTEKKLDLACRIMLVDVIAGTDRFDCLVRFVQIRGLPVLDEWLQEVHKGKIGDGNGQKESDKCVEEFLLALLRALDKLPVNLHALQTCNVGKSVNNLRSHKNSEIQKKARSLVDTWKKRVEAEMNMIESKSGSARGGSWPTKSVLSEVSHVVTRRTGGSSDVGIKSSSVQSSAGKTPQGRLGSGEAVAKFASASAGTAKSAASGTTSGAASSKDTNSAILVCGGASDLPLSTIKEEKSSSSSQSQNNSQSCSSDQAKTGGSSCREDARSSTAGSVSVNRISSSGSRQRKLSNGLHGSTSAVSGIQKDTGFGKFSSLSRHLTPEKESPTRVTHERVSDLPPVDHGNNQRLIVRLPNNGLSPARTASGGFEDPAVTTCKASPTSHSEKHDHHDRKVKGKSEALRAGGASYINMDICQGKDGVAVSDEGNMSSTGAHCDERSGAAEDGEKMTEASKVTGPASGTATRPGKSYDASYSSINALIESCVKFSEASTSASVGDDIGMNLLASVAAGEMPRSDVSPLGSPGKNSPVPEDSCSGDDVKSRHLEEDIARSKDQLISGANSGPTSEQVSFVNTLCIKDDSQCHATPVSTDFPGDGKGTLSGYEEKAGECCALLNDSSSDLKQPECGPCLTSNGKHGELTHDAPVVMSSVDVTKEGNSEAEPTNQFHEQRKSSAAQVKSNRVSNSKVKARSLFDEDRKINYADEKAVENSAVMGIETSINVKVEKGANEESPSCSSSEFSGDIKNDVHKGSDSGILAEKLPAPASAPAPAPAPVPVVNIHLGSIGGKSEAVAVAPSSGSCNALGMDIKVDKTDEIQGGSCTVQNEKQKSDLGAAILDHNNECAEKLEKKEVTGDCPSKSATHEVSPGIAVKEPEECMKSSEFDFGGVKADGTEAPASSLNATLLPVARSDMAVKLDFDLNEGFTVDDGSHGELVKSSIPENWSTIHLPCPRSFPASITVASAAKGSFFPPENPSRSKGELGWKGSAATSAFRPAEPRKVLDMPLSTTEIPLVDHTTNKQRRPPLDIDLNVPDQRVLDDVASRNSALGTCSESGPHNRRGGGGLDLDLNRVDESPEIGQFSVSNSCRIEIPQLPGRSSLSVGFSNGELNGLRGFDLNNGPGPEEAATETPPHAKSSLQFLSPAPGVRMNNAELGNFSSLFPAGNSYSSVAIPFSLPGRGEQSYPIVTSTGSQRMLGLSTGGTFGPEIYRGPVLSSSPAVGFSPATSFQYPGFPFETNFPLPSNSYSGCSTAYVDSSSSGPLCFPGIPSQLVGPTGVVSSHYPRPLVMNLPGGTCSAGPDTRKWGGQSLDLNAGPGGTDVERRDDRLASALRQLPVGGSQALTDEQLKIYQMEGDGVLKRKEPDGGWDGDRLSYKQPSWQ